MDLEQNSKSNYTYSYKDGKYLCFETGTFGFKIDNTDLTKVHFGIFDEHHNVLSYSDVTSNASISNRMDTQLEEQEFIVEITERVNGNVQPLTYRMTSARQTRLWESGMITQHYDMKQLMTNDENIPDAIDATLYIMIWPDSITLTYL